MGIIICQSCERTIDHVEEEKVSTLYATCNSCTCNSDQKEK
ncbi:GapA-binding peptide SR1P [Bacillus sp. AK128]